MHVNENYVGILTLVGGAWEFELSINCRSFIGQWGGDLLVGDAGPEKRNETFKVGTLRMDKKVATHFNQKTFGTFSVIKRYTRKRNRQGIYFPIIYELPMWTDPSKLYETGQWPFVQIPSLLSSYFQIS